MEGIYGRSRDFRTLQASFVQIMRVLLHLRLQDCSLARADQEKSLFGTHEEPRNDSSRTWPRVPNAAGSAKEWLAQHVDCASCNWRNFAIREAAILVII